MPDQTCVAKMKRLTHFLLLNACALPFSGFYHGKAGVALALFEAARALKDESVEDEAYELFQEALLTKSKETNEADGLGGIGFVLWYLTRYGFIEADVHELFGEQLQLIQTTCRQARATDAQHVWQEPVLLWHVMGMKEMRNRALNLMEMQLEALGKTCERWTHFTGTEDMLERWRVYWRTAFLSTDYHPPRETWQLYVSLYQKNRISSDECTHYYLWRLSERLPNCTPLQSVATNGYTLMRGSYLNAVRPTDVWLRSLFHQMQLEPFRAEAATQAQERFVDVSEAALDKRFALLFHTRTDGVVGMHAGVAGWLLFLCYMFEAPFAGCDIERFNYLLS